MPHSSNDVTSRYIASYGYEQTVEYNSLLLYDKGSEEHILSQINALSEEERIAIVQKLNIEK